MEYRATEEHVQAIAMPGYLAVAIPQALLTCAASLAAFRCGDKLLSILFLKCCAENESRAHYVQNWGSRMPFSGLNTGFEVSTKLQVALLQ